MFVRWRAVLSYLSCGDPSPYHDPVLAKLLISTDNATTLHLLAAFDTAFELAGQLSHEMSLDRHPDLGPVLRKAPHQTSKRRVALRRRKTPEARLVSKFRWLGQLAYAQGIDRSPTHDRTVRTELKKHDNSVVLGLLRAWESGWDEAYDYVKELGLERRSVLDAPKVLSARTIQKPRDSIKKR